MNYLNLLPLDWCQRVYIERSIKYEFNNSRIIRDILTIFYYRLNFIKNNNKNIK